MQENTTKQKFAFNDALKIDKKSTDATLGLAKVYNGKKQPEKALDMLKKTGENMKKCFHIFCEKGFRCMEFPCKRLSERFLKIQRSIFKETGKRTFMSHFSPFTFPLCATYHSNYPIAHNNKYCHLFIMQWINSEKPMDMIVAVEKGQKAKYNIA